MTEGSVLATVKAVEAAEAETREQAQASAESLLQVNEAAMEAVCRASEAAARAAADIGIEMVQFTNRWFRDVLNVSRSSLQSNGNWNYIFNSQNEFFVGATQSCLDEANRILALANRAARDTRVPWENFYRDTVGEAARRD